MRQHASGLGPDAGPMGFQQAASRPQQVKDSAVRPFAGAHWESETGYFFGPPVGAG